MNINKLPIPIATKLYDALIKPILLYASEVWEPFIKNDPEGWDKNEIEKTYLQFLRQILGVNRSATRAMVRGELNQHSLQEEVLRRHINYAKYIQGKEDTSIVKQAYTYELNRPNENTSFFSTMQKHTAEIYELNNTFHPYADPYVNIYEITKLRSVTHEIFHREWKRKLEDSSKCDTYRLFKDQMKFELYLLHPNRKERVAMTKLRISDHKLMIETERHKTPIPPREERLCYMCSTKIEDEVHFLTECKLYGSNNDFWQKVYQKFPQTTHLNNKDKFVFLMTQEDQEIMQILLNTVKEWHGFRTFLCNYFYE